jgi:organic radical activating enzyme
MTTDEILKEIMLLPSAPYITFTGGDPAIQSRLGDIIPTLNANGMRVAIETQGMFFPDWLQKCDVLTFSPKGPSSGNVVKPMDLSTYCVSLGKKRRQRVCIKIVCFDEEDFAYAMAVYRLIPSIYYDAFYFTAGTPLIEEPEAIRDMPNVELTDEDKNARAMGRVLMVIQNQLALAELMLKKENSSQFNEKVHLGCQQHVLLWPGEDKGV